MRKCAQKKKKKLQKIIDEHSRVEPGLDQDRRGTLWPGRRKSRRKQLLHAASTMP
jgi:hypothetical protein